MNPNDPKEWASLFDVDLGGNAPPLHTPAWNNHKLNALGMKYKALSDHYDLRKPDNPNVEIEEEFYGVKGLNEPQKAEGELPENQGKIKNKRPYYKKRPFPG